MHALHAGEMGDEDRHGPGKGTEHAGGVAPMADLGSRRAQQMQRRGQAEGADQRRRRDPAPVMMGDKLLEHGRQNRSPFADDLPERRE